MVSDPRRGEVWWVEIPDKRRPVLGLTRDAAIPVLGTLLVAPMTRRLRDTPTEVPLGCDDGMPAKCAVTLDDSTVADKGYFAGARPGCRPAVWQRWVTP